MKTAIIYGLTAMFAYASPGRAEDGNPQSIREGLECRLQLQEHQDGCVSELNGKREALIQRMDEKISACLKTYGDDEPVQRGNCANNAMRFAGRDLSQAYRDGAECLRQASTRYQQCLEKKSPKK